MSLDGRCGECGWHVPTMSHQKGCSRPEPFAAPPESPCPEGVSHFYWLGVEFGIASARQAVELGWLTAAQAGVPELAPPPRVALPISGPAVEASCRRSIETLAARMETEAKGSRNNNLAGRAKTAFRIALRGGIPDVEVYDRFVQACQVSGLWAEEEPKCRATLRGAWRDAQAQGPADPPTAAGGIAPARQIATTPRTVLRWTKPGTRPAFGAAHV